MPAVRPCRRPIRQQRHNVDEWQRKQAPDPAEPRANPTLRATQGEAKPRGELQGKSVAFVVTDGFEQVALTGTRELLEKAGARTVVVSPGRGTVRGFNHHDPGQEFAVDRSIDEVRADEFDAVVLPGGVMNPDALRVVPRVRSFVRAFAADRKPIAAICHGPWTLIDAGLVKGKRITSWPSLETDLRNAGARWVDEECVEDQGLITSRKPDDIPTFARRIVAALRAQGASAVAAP